MYISTVSYSPKSISRAFARDICKVLLIAYIALIPGGLIGFVIAFTCLLLKLSLTRDMVTLGVYFLIFGMKTMGLVTLAFGFPGLGGKVAFVFALLIFFFFTNLKKLLVDLRISLIQMIWIIFVFYIFFLIGPQTQYSSEKLSDIIVFGIVFMISFYYLLNFSSVDWFHLGQLGVLSALVCLASIVIIAPIAKPDTITDIGSIRIALETMDLGSVRNILGTMAILGFVILYASGTDRVFSRNRMLEYYVYLCVALILLAWGGARLPLVSAVVVALTIFLVKPQHTKKYWIFIMVLIVFSGLFLSYSLNQKIQFVESVVDSERTIYSRLNRESNWEAGYRRFIESPFLGHGLGGYYIEGFSNPGEGTYAHNIVLELLSETGAIGTITIIATLFIGLTRKNVDILIKRAKNGNAIFPLFLALLLQAMISYDLATNIVFISFITVVFRTNVPIAQKNKTQLLFTNIRHNSGHLY